MLSGFKAAGMSRLPEWVDITGCSKSYPASGRPRQ